MKFRKSLFFWFAVTVFNMIMAISFVANSINTLHCVVLIITISMTIVSLVALLLDARLRYKGAYDQSKPDGEHKKEPERDW